MRQKRCRYIAGAALWVLALALLLTPDAWAASKYKVLHKFSGGEDGGSPFAGLILDAAGNLYGTTYAGGLNNYGTVFELELNSDGSWTEKVLHRFTGGNDGSYPEAGLVFDQAGNLYGTTVGGGAGMDGTVFELEPNSDGSWTERVLHSFTGSDDGAFPYCAPIFDVDGNLYGTTLRGGGSDRCTEGCGIAFKLSPGADGNWTETVLHRFGADGADVPGPGLVLDATGSLYGTAGGGLDGYGKVFKLRPDSDGSWTQIVLYNFTGGVDGQYPNSTPIFDATGDLYGTTVRGGTHDDGTVFKLGPKSDNPWKESILHSFADHPGFEPTGGVTFDGAGNLYGVTFFGGPESAGVVFKLAPRSHGSWAFHVLHVFYNKPAALPEGGLILNKAGNLYGTTEACGNDPGCWGVVYEVTP